LWITRITAGLKPLGHNYSTFISQLTKKKILVNRKIIAELALNNQNEFKALVDKAFA
jgi:large subunit ribosomal protein L20